MASVLTIALQLLVRHIRILQAHTQRVLLGSYEPPPGSVVHKDQSLITLYNGIVVQVLI